MSILTSGKCISSLIVALQNNNNVTSLLGSGVNGIGSGTVNAKTKYPYILIDWAKVRTKYAMGRVEIESTAMVNISIFAEDTPSTPAKESISTIGEALSAALSEEGALTITGRNVDPPVFDQITANKTQAISETQVISWENQVWDMFSTPAE